MYSKIFVYSFVGYYNSVSRHSSSAFSKSIAREGAPVYLGGISKEITEDKGLSVSGSR
jgi:hypothetical protein